MGSGMPSTLSGGDHASTVGLSPSTVKRARPAPSP